MPVEDAEDDVRDKFCRKLLDALGWRTDQWHGGLWVKVPSGREKIPKQPDVVLCARESIVRRPGESKRYAPVGKSWLVIEFKRPEEALVGAELQARSYQSAIYAPLYMAINGRALMLWQARRMGAPEALIPETPLNALRSIKSTLETHIGAHTLPKYLEELKRHDAEAFDTALKRAKERALSENWTFIDILHRGPGIAAWCGLPPDEDFLPWGGLDGAPTAPVFVRCNLRPEDLAQGHQIDSALARMGVHGGIRCLFVPPGRVEAWLLRVRDVAGECLGREDCNWEPVAGNAHASQWTIQSLDDDKLVDFPEAGESTAELLDCASIATHLHTAMDAWCWTHAKHLMDRGLSLDDVASLDALGLRVHNEVREILRLRWEALRNALDAEDCHSLRQHYLHGTLSPPHERDAARARVRLGPRNMTQLVRALLLQLVVADALNVSTAAFLPESAHSRDLRKNVRLAELPGHLLAISHHKRRRILRALAREAGQVQLPLLASGSTASHADAREQFAAPKRITGPARNVRLNEPLDLEVLVVTLSERLEDNLESGIEEVRGTIISWVQACADDEARLTTELTQ